MKNTDADPKSGDTMLSTLRGKITATILTLLALNEIGRASCRERV